VGLKERNAEVPKHTITRNGTRIIRELGLKTRGVRSSIGCNKKKKCGEVGIDILQSGVPAWNVGAICTPTFGSTAGRTKNQKGFGQRPLRLRLHVLDCVLGIAEGSRTHS
jgi:hypothetical protein